MEIKIAPQKLFKILTQNNIDRQEAKAIICDLVMEMSGCVLVADATESGEVTDVETEEVPENTEDDAMSFGDITEKDNKRSRVRKPLNFKNFGGLANPIA